MPQRKREERVGDYLKLITAHMGGVEAVLATLGSEGAGGGLESAAPSDPMVGQARAGLESIERGNDPTPEESGGLEAIIIPALRPVFYVVRGSYAADHPLWTKLSTDAATKKRIEAAIPSIGRIELPGLSGIPYGGTGFVVGPGLLMTNRHVAEIFTRGLGSRVDFIPGRKAAIDFLREHDRAERQHFAAKRIRMVHPYWDMAILEVEGLPEPHVPLRLAVEDARDMTATEVVVVGYPAFDGRNPEDVQNDLFSGRFGVKRLQPGLLQGGFDTESFRKIVTAATHDCSTLGGNSGSAVIEINTGMVVALHFGGRYEERNYAVPTGELARDSRVVDAGVSFGGEPRGDPNDWGDWWARADGDEAAEASGGTSTSSAAAVAPAGGGSVVRNGGSVAIEVPLRITVSLGSAQQAGTVLSIGEAPSAGDSLEAMREPFHEEDYEERAGYQSDFLGRTDVPMPQAASQAVVARTLAGGIVLAYQNFSVVMHAKRRLALITAVNVTREPALRRPEPGRDYTRRGLSGLGENDQERWFRDPRLADEFQLPDIFFTRDEGAFDKGHLVRREDAAWGENYALLRRANGDTYHGTNCSPQVKGFNQSQHGDVNWGDLENHVLAEAASERLCVFAGPVLRRNDGVFEGRGAGGTVIRARVPSAFWKVIVGATRDGIAAYGFVLEQDLSDVPLEFTVAEEFLPTMRSLRAIEKLAGVIFADVVRETDQFDTVRGMEVAMRARTKRQ